MGRALAWSLIAIAVIAVTFWLIPAVMAYVTRRIDNQ